MPKLGMEPIRRTALIDAAIREIGRAGTLDVTVSQIAKRAGVSSALAHHYFGSKERIFLAAMRHILASFGAGARRRLAAVRTPRARLQAIVEACFGEDQVDPDIIAAWLLFYVQAQTSPEAARLLRVYRRRLHSNLVHELARMVPRPRAQEIAAGVGALVDGVYVRHALPEEAPGQAETIALVLDYIDLSVGAVGAVGAAGAAGAVGAVGAAVLRKAG
jgi:TetR/AcrR family transcriptional repressor of bet genes